MAPNYELLKVHGIAFSDGLDAAVRAVAYPATQTELAGAIAAICLSPVALRAARRLELHAAAEMRRS